MQVKELSSDGLKKELSVTISAKDIEEKVEDRLKEVGKQARIPGFRPGKVPTKVLKQRYGQAVMGEILEQAVNEGSQQVLAERGLRPAQQPRIEVTKFDEGEDLEFKMDVELMPEIEPMDFSELSLERLSVKVPDSEVEEALENIAQNQKSTKPLDAPRPGQKGDVLVIDFRGSVDGEELPGMAAEDHNLELGSNRFVEGFEEQLIGAEIGDEREVKVTFPKEYVNDKLAGREAIFQVKIKDILESVPRPVDDEMAQALGEESLDSLKERIREQIAGEYSSITRSKTKRELLDKLAENHDFDVPPGMVDAEFDVIWEQVEKDREQGNVDPEDEGKSEDELKQEYRDIARRRVRLGLLLSEVGRLNNIEVSQDELNRAIIQEAQRHPGQEQQVFEFFQQNQDALANLRAPLYEDKVVDFILEMADVTDREVTPEELRDELSGEGQDADQAEEKKKPAKKASGSKKASGAKKTSDAKKASGGEKKSSTAKKASGSQKSSGSKSGGTAKKSGTGAKKTTPSKGASKSASKG